MSCKDSCMNDKIECSKCSRVGCISCLVYRDQHHYCRYCQPEEKSAEEQTLGFGKYYSTPLKKVPLQYLFHIQNSDKVSRRAQMMAWGEVKRRRDKKSKCSRPKRRKKEETKKDQLTMI